MRLLQIYVEFSGETFKMKIVDIHAIPLSAPLAVPMCKKIANLASAFNIPYAPHVWGSAISHLASLHLAASIPNFLICEVDRLPNPLRENLALNPMQIQNGYIKLPQASGLGIELNEKIVKKYTI